MKPLKLMAAIVVGVAVSGCAAVDTASRNAPFLEPSSEGGVGEVIDSVDLRLVSVREINVSVPHHLVVSEKNSYYPSGDIVWRGDAPGNRYMQIEAIFEQGLSQGIAELTGSVPAVLDIEVERFHSLTEKTRYSFGGVHSIRFQMTLRHADTGVLIAEPKTVKANLKGFGGQRAIDAERAGQTQKVRIVDHLSRVIREELGRPAPALDAVAATDSEIPVF